SRQVPLEATSRGASCSLGRPVRKSHEGALVADLLRQLVPLDPVTDLRPKLPLDRLRARIGVLTDLPGLVERIVGSSLGNEVTMHTATQLDQLVEVAGDRPPPAPVLTHDLAD